MAALRRTPIPDPQDDRDLKSIARDVQQLKHDVHSQGNILGLILYSQAEEFIAKVIKALTTDEVLLEIYRRVDGVQTKSRIVKDVVDLNLVGGKQASVYSKFVQLENLGVIEPVAEAGRTGIYRKSSISEGLRIEHEPAYKKAIKNLGPRK